MEKINPESRIDKEVLGNICLHAEEAYPYEGCGVLLSKKGSEIVSGSVRAKNRVSGESAGTHFLLDPLEIYDIEKKAEDEGYDVAGFYHTHPEHEAIPSDEDKLYMIPEQLYLIVSVISGRCSDAALYIRKV